MKTIIKNLFAIIFLVANITTVFSQNNTSVDVSIKAQLMKMDGQLYIFLTDEKGTPYDNKDITATGKVKNAAGKTKVLTLSVYGATGFVVKESVGEFNNLKATFHLENSKYHVIFYATFDGKGKNETMYSCPMHPYDLMNAEGKCPKCGMSTEAKKVTTFHPMEIVRKGSL